MSPSTVERTSVSVTPRAAAMLAIPEVMQAAIAWSRNSTGVGASSPPTSTAGWSASYSWTPLCACTPPAPLNGSIRLRLFVPRIQRFVARNWNFASSG